jgi:ERF superfamily
MTKTKIKDQPDLLGTSPQAAEIVPVKTPRKKTEIANLPVPTAMRFHAIIEDAMTNPNVDVAKLRELLNMQKEIIAEERVDRAEAARVAFTRDFIALQQDLPEIRRDGRIVIESKNGKRGQSTPYATYENIYRTIKPILREHSFTFWTEPLLGEEGRIVIRSHLDHVAGHGKTCEIALPLETSGSKNNVQGAGSSISYGKRYGIISLCSIISFAPDDRDVDGRANEDINIVVISEDDEAKLRQAIEDCGVPLETFCGKYNIEQLAQLPVKDLKDAHASCKRFKTEREARKHAG